jgi:DNA modification methylase
VAETFLDGKVTLHVGDVRAKLRELPADYFDCVVTSPPYWGLRDYGTGRWEGGEAECQHYRVGTERTAWANSVKGPGNPGKNGLQCANMTKVVGGHCSKCNAVFTDFQIGMEPTLGEHLDVMVDVFDEVRRVLKPTGPLWLNYGDCYATSPNGRSAADTKAAGNDDRTFRDKPFSTIGGVLKAKDLCMVPNRLAIALQEAGWWVRSEIIWGKRNGMPDSSGKYRPSTAHEKVFLLSKTGTCFYDSDAVALPCSSSTNARVSQDVANQVGSARANGGAKTNGNMKAVTRKSWKGSSFDGPRDRQRHPDIGRNRALPGHGSMDAALAIMPETRYLRNYEAAPLSVWPMATTAFSEAHFATFPPELVERCIKAGCPAGGNVLDVFGGAGTTGLVAATLGRAATLIELNPEYAILARARIEAAFMGRDEGARHMAKQLGKDRVPFEPGSLFAGIEAAE